MRMYVPLSLSGALFAFVCLCLLISVSVCLSRVMSLSGYVSEVLKSHTRTASCVVRASRARVRCRCSRCCPYRKFTCLVASSIKWKLSSRAVSMFTRSPS